MARTAVITRHPGFCDDGSCSARRCSRLRAGKRRSRDHAAQYDEARRSQAALRKAVDDKDRAIAEKELDKVQKKLVADTAKALSVPAKASATDVTAATQLFPERRLRQPRTFPSVTPAVPTVIFAWPGAMPTAQQEMALRRLLARMVRLGHSASFVHARIVDAPAVDAGDARLTRFITDSDNGRLMLRWVAPGQVDRLIAAFARHRETEPRVLPATFVRYREGIAAPVSRLESTVFDDDRWVVLARVGGPRLPSTASAGVVATAPRAYVLRRSATA